MDLQQFKALDIDVVNFFYEFNSYNYYTQVGEIQNYVFYNFIFYDIGVRNSVFFK